MTDDELAELIRDCPTLYHMAERGSWPNIRDHGLMSTSALLDQTGLDGPARAAIEVRRRPTSVALTHPAIGRAVIRDQKPMDDAGLRRCLTDGLSPEDWYRLLNGRVFFWLTTARLSRLLNARANIAAEHDVLQIASAPLIAAYAGTITLSAINSGTTIRAAPARGRATFLPIVEYPYAAWRAKRPRGERVVELTVPYGVPDIARFVDRVVTMRREVVTGVIYEH